MRYKQALSFITTASIAVLALIFIFFSAPSLPAQTEDLSNCGCSPPEPEKKPTFDIFGFAMVDMIPDFKVNDPDWFDVVRPTKLPAFKGQFGEDGHFYGSVRQTRFGVKSSVPVGNNELKVVFDFDLFGVGVDAGQTTIRLRHAYGELGAFGGGQTESAFMDSMYSPTQWNIGVQRNGIFQKCTSPMDADSRRFPLNHRSRKTRCERRCR